MGALDLFRSLPRGVRPPGPVIGDRTSQPGYVLSEIMYEPTPLQGNWGPSHATPDMVRGMPAAWYCSNLIAGTVAQMDLEDIDPKTNEPVDPMPQVLSRPWPMLSYFDFVFMGITSVINSGNFYAIKYDFDEATLKPRQLLPVATEDMTVTVDNGVPYYSVAPIDKTFTWDDIFHVRGLCIPGRMTGIGVVEAFRLGLGNIKTLMDFGDNAYTGGAVPPMVMTVDKPELDEGEAEYLQTRWMTRHAAGNRVPAVVPKIVTVQPMGMSMVDADYLNSRKFSIAEIAFMYGINPTLLTISLGGPHVTYQNVETKNRETLIYSFQPWMSRYEQACNDLLPGARGAKFNTDNLLRAAENDRVKTYVAGLDAGIYTLNEVRKREGLQPYEGWADKPFGTPPPPPIEPTSAIPQEKNAQPQAAGAAGLDAVMTGTANPTAVPPTKNGSKAPVPA